MAKPWLFGALTIVALETLADFGTVTIFAVDTFTTAIYKTWTGFFSIQTAQQLASLLLLAILVFFCLAEFFGCEKKSYAVQDLQHCYRRIKLHGWLKGVVIGYALSLAFFSAILPLGVLFYWVTEVYQQLPFDHTVLINSAIIAIGAGTLATFFALLINLAKHNLSNNRIHRVASNLLVLGYAVPGTVLAVAVVRFFDSLLPVAGLLISLFFALVIRYAAVFTTNLDHALQRIPRIFRDVSHALGRSGITVLRRLYLPLLAPSIGYTFLIVVIETLKEMPLTLMTRPFGWDTLAIKIFEYTSEGQWDKASYPALWLVLLGLIPVYFFSHLYHKA